MALTERQATRLNRAMPVMNDIKLGNIIRDLQQGSEDGSDIPEGGVTTEKIADGAVTDEKLAKRKIDMPDALTAKVVLGTTLETSQLGLVGYSQEPFADQLVMYQFGGQVAVATPQADGDAATKKYVDDAIPNIANMLASVEAIADPSTATTEDIANKLNEILTALKG